MCCVSREDFILSYRHSMNKSLLQNQYDVGVPTDLQREVYMAQSDDKDGKRITTLRDGSVLFLHGSNIVDYVPMKYTVLDDDVDELMDFYRIMEVDIHYPDIQIGCFDHYQDAVSFAERYAIGYLRYDSEYARGKKLVIRDEDNRIRKTIDIQ